MIQQRQSQIRNGLLALGPMFGVWAMRASQQPPAALQLAEGRG